MSYRYMARWNDWTLGPVPQDEDGDADFGQYWDEGFARERYESDEWWIEVIPEPDAVSGVPAWSMHVYPAQNGGADGADVFYYDAQGSISHIVGFRAPPDQAHRWYREEVLEYTYPVEPVQRWDQGDCVLLRAGYTKPDGTAEVIETDDRVSPPSQTVARYRGVPVVWVDKPAFGQWSVLVDAEFLQPRPAVGVLVSEETDQLVAGGSAAITPPGELPDSEFPDSMPEAEYALAVAVYGSAVQIRGWDHVQLRATLEGDLSVTCFEGDRVVGLAELTPEVVAATADCGLVAKMNDTDWSEFTLDLDYHGSHTVTYVIDGP